MAVLRQFNALGQERIDVPHVRSIESAVAGDFDTLIGRAVAGDRPLVIRGFALSNVTVGTAANQIQLLTADSIAYNLKASESGSFLWVPSDRAAEVLSTSNGKVTGSFTSNTVNYVSIDFTRMADDTTTDLAQFMSASTLVETGREVPLGRTLDYRIVISTAPFSTSSNVIPIAKITTDTNNAVTVVLDARPMLHRLGSGGDFPNSQSSYTYPFGRQETATTNAFAGGDKNILSQKDWLDAVMTRIWELGGGENWYSPTADRNVRMVRAPSPAVFSNGENFEFISSNLHWQGLSIVFDNANTANVYHNDIVDQTVNDVSVAATTLLAVGECLYVDIDRTSNRTGGNALVVKRTPLQSLGTPTIPGTRYIIAWRGSDGNIFTRDYAYPVNVTFSPATTSSLGAVRLNETAATPALPTVVTLGTNNAIHVGTGAYTIGGNTDAITTVGGGTGTGITATGGAGSAAAGVSGTGGGSVTLGGHGVRGTGTAGSIASGSGVFGLSPSSGVRSAGVIGYSAATNNVGVAGISSGLFTSLTTFFHNEGVLGLGNLAAGSAGVKGISQDAGSSGVVAVANGATNPTVTGGEALYVSGNAVTNAANIVAGVGQQALVATGGAGGGVAVNAIGGSGLSGYGIFAIGGNDTGAGAAFGVYGQAGDGLGGGDGGDGGSFAGGLGTAPFSPGAGVSGYGGSGAATVGGGPGGRFIGGVAGAGGDGGQGLIATGGTGVAAGPGVEAHPGAGGSVAIKAVGGHVQIPGTRSVTYQTGTEPSRITHFSAGDMQFNATYWGVDAGAVGVPILSSTTTTSGGASWFCPIKIPRNSVVTEIRALINNTTGAAIGAGMNLWVTKNTYNTSSTNYTTTYWNTNGVTGDNTGSLANGSFVWFSIPLTITGTPTDAMLVVSGNQPSGTAGTKIWGVRVVFTQIDIEGVMV